jgi:hypothetical protein
MRLRRVLERGAFSLMETTVSTLLVSILLVTSVSTVAHVNRVASSENHDQLSAQLASLYFAEITSKPFTSPSNTSTAIGLDPNETSSDRTTWDDCDDYDGLSLNGLTWANGSAIPSLENWSLAVTVGYSDPSNPLTEVGSVTELKLIQLVFTDPAGTDHTFQALRSLYGPLLDADDQDLLSSMEVSATGEIGGIIVAASRVLNQQGTP